MLVLTIYLVKSVRLTQSTALEEERFNLRSLSRAFRNLRLLLVYLHMSLFSHSVKEHRPSEWKVARSIPCADQHSGS